MDNRGRLPIDFNYYSTEDEEDMSDYDVNEKELYPPSAPTESAARDSRNKAP